MAVFGKIFTDVTLLCQTPIYDTMQMLGVNHEIDKIVCEKFGV